LSDLFFNKYVTVISDGCKTQQTNKIIVIIKHLSVDMQRKEENKHLCLNQMSHCRTTFNSCYFSQWYNGRYANTHGQIN
jgi:hypothetical protein